MKYPQCRILIFAKSPVPGTCKTRLGRDIGFPRAAAVYRQLLTYNINMAVQSNVAPVELWCAPNTKHAFFLHCRRTWGVTLKRQHVGNLGQKMHTALRCALKCNEAALIIGGDCPVLQPKHLQLAMAALQASDDAVFAPTEDGGYALVGMRTAHARLFHNIRWSTPQVMSQTYRRLDKLELACTTLPMVWDVDDRIEYLRAKQEGLVN